MDGLGDVGFEACVSVFVARHFLAVDIYVGYVHDAFEVEKHSPAFQRFGHIEGLAVPAFTHALEAASLVFVLCPRLLELVVVGQVEGAPIGVVIVCALRTFGVTKAETPAKVEQLMTEG